MYDNVSAQFKTRLYKDSRTFRAKMIFDATPNMPAITLSDEIMSLKIESGSNPTTELKIGSTPCTVSEFELCGALSQNIKGRDFLLKIGLLVGNSIGRESDYEYIPIGKFTVQDAPDHGGRIKVTAADFMAKTDKPYSTSLLYPNTAENVINDICVTLGISFQSGFDFKGYTMATAPQGKTFREMIGYIAGMYGKSACFDRNGILCFKWYEEPDAAYTFDYERIKEPKIDAGYYVCEYINVTLSDGTVISTTDIDTTELYGIDVENPYMTNGKLSDISNSGTVLLIEYKPASVEMLLGDPLIDPFDILHINVDGIDYNILPMTLKYEFDGGLMAVVESTIKEKASYTSPSQRAAANTSTAIRDAVAVNRAVNGQTITIGSAERQILSVPMSVTNNAKTYIVFTSQSYLTAGGTTSYILKLNNTPVFTFKQISVIGDNVMTFMYPFEGLQAGTYAVSVHVISSNAAGTIESMAANAIITGQGLTSAISWNGILTLAAELSPVTMSDDNGMTVGAFGTESSVSLLTPQTSQLSAELAAVTMSDDNGMTVSGFATGFTVGEYPYCLGMTSDGTTKVYITLDGEITQDSTLAASLASFTIQSIVGGVSTFYTPQSITATYDAVNSETTLEITTTDFSAAEYIDVAYNANTGTLHVGTVAEGHKVPAFSDTINFNRS